jgi:hypothetical protein
VLQMVTLSKLCSVQCDTGMAEQSKFALSSPSSSSGTSHQSGDGDLHRPETPPTDVSSTLSSPTFAIPPALTSEAMRRREQSDKASARIGERLLKGWAMLGEECPNATCYGVPLVRPPGLGTVKDPRKVCHRDIFHV